MSALRIHYYTSIQAQLHLRCHHCDSQRPVCRVSVHIMGSTHIVPVGLGTEQLEQALSPSSRTCRFLESTGDTTSRKGRWNSSWQKCIAAARGIPIGTQMLAKGHHFPDVTLVVPASDVDGALFSPISAQPSVLPSFIPRWRGGRSRAGKQGEVVLLKRTILSIRCHQTCCIKAMTPLPNRRWPSARPYGCRRGPATHHPRGRSPTTSRRAFPAAVEETFCRPARWWIINCGFWAGSGTRAKARRTFSLADLLQHPSRIRLQHIVSGTLALINTCQRRAK